MSGNSDALILAALERLEASQTQLRAELATGMERLQDAVGAMDARIAAMEMRMDAQDETLSRFRADLVDELGRTRSALMARMDRLQEVLVRQHENDVVNFGAAERAERIAKGAVDEGEDTWRAAQCPYPTSPPARGGRPNTAGWDLTSGFASSHLPMMG